MRIVFDIWLGAKEKEYSLEESTLLHTIYDFVEDRVKVLEKELDEEERIGDATNPNGFIAIVMELKRKRISFIGYSSELTDKLKACFTDKDSEMLQLRLTEAFNYLN